MVWPNAVAVAAALLLGGCAVDPASQTQSQAQTQTSADWVFTNAKVYTLDASQPWVSAVAVAGDKIVYVGSDTAAQRWVGEATTRIDLGGRVLLPGFIDTHVHPLSGGAYAAALSLDLSLIHI